jgi:GNAT superfamily N-acetyltransferase
MSAAEPITTTLGGVSWTIRVASEGDISAVLALWTLAEVEPGQTDDQASLRRLIDRDPGALLVAQAAGGALAGSVIAGWDGWRGSIYRLAVAPAHRRRGVARRLLAAAEERLAALGAVRLQRSSSAPTNARPASGGPATGTSRPTASASPAASRQTSDRACYACTSITTSGVKLRCP